MKNRDSEDSDHLIPVADILGRSLRHAIEGITGIAASEKRVWVLSLGHILQRVTAGQFLSALMEEWDDYRKRGRIQDDYDFSQQCRSCLQELLEFLDKDLADENRFNLLKQIFLVAATETASDRSSHLPLQYMQLARSLTAGEVLVLNTTYRMLKEGASLDNGAICAASEWTSLVAENSGLCHAELVELHEAELIKKRLLTERRPGDSVASGNRFRLTALGHAMCTYIDHYSE